MKNNSSLEKVKDIKVKINVDSLDNFGVNVDTLYIHGPIHGLGVPEGHNKNIHNPPSCFLNLPTLSHPSYSLMPR